MRSDSHIFDEYDIVLSRGNPATVGDEICFYHPWQDCYIFGKVVNIRFFPSVFTIRLPKGSIEDVLQISFEQLHDTTIWRKRRDEDERRKRFQQIQDFLNEVNGGKHERKRR
ncbi:hypothetical protein J2T38_002307 [Neisseria perflava]|uniref:hypothetical protein n=1 Tax=Neisseria perflava TaxID=33053 RepID=UPI00209C786D|nr:hypothetical protein [Neisseria perflava]MCP1773453.1 hypothetical protein [Neisseria perflava]